MSNDVTAEMFNDINVCLLEQMIKDKFGGENIDKYVISKQDLYEFSLKLIKVIKNVYE